MDISVTISIVSHNQIALVEKLLSDIADSCEITSLEVILTLNLPEKLPFDEGIYPFPLRVVGNLLPQGFGENHNQAFRLARGKFFCVLNPDIRLREDAFKSLTHVLEQHDSVGLAAPRVVNSNGDIEDSARRFPSIGEIVGKVFGRSSRRYELGSDRIAYPDWVAGMFMLVPMAVFGAINGFDTRYFLYYEDVDLCARLKLAGYRVALCQDVAVVHDAQRASHRNFKYLRWHFLSMLRFFTSAVYRKVCQLTPKKT